MRHARHPSLLRFLRLLLSVGIPLALLLLLYRDSYPGVFAEPTKGARPGGYGISVAATIGPRPDLLDALNMDWVYIYDTNQLESYPDQYVLYRIDLTNWPADAWVQGLPALAKVLRQADVSAVAIGNEPNLTEGWGNGKPNAKNYTQGLCAAYKVFKQVAPQIVVVSAGLAPTAGTPDGMNVNDLDFAQKMLDAGAANCFDAWGYHPYGFDQPPEADPQKHPFSFRRAELMEQVLQNNGVLGKQMWMTEWGWVRNPAEDGLNCATDEAFNRFTWMAVSAQTQADYTVRAFRFADQNWPWAGPMFLWNLNWSQISNLDQEPLCSHLRFYSIIGSSGQPLPVFFSLQRVIPPHPPRVHHVEPGGQPAPEPGTEPGGPQAGVEYRPEVGAVAHHLAGSAEAGCAGVIRLGSFTVYNSGYPGHLEVNISAANAPGRPLVWTSTMRAVDGDEVDVFVDTHGVAPGLYLIAINLRAFGTSRMSSQVVRGWLLLHYPTSPDCLAQLQG